MSALSLRNHREDALGTWSRALVFDPHGKYVHQVVARISGLDTRQLERIAIGSWLYAAVFLVEGTGLALRRRWAEVLTVIVTTSFIPLEIYELVEHWTWPKIAVIAINVLIVIYLVLRLGRERHGPFRR